MKRCLITGCSGFIGRHFVTALLRGLPRGHADASTQPGVELFHGDLTQAETLNGIGSGIDIIFHAAGHAHGCLDIQSTSSCFERPSTDGHIFEVV